MGFLEKLDLSNRRNLARTISLIESHKKEDQEIGNQLLQDLHTLFQENQFSNARVIAITGTPGAGKSTFIDAFGTMLADSGAKIAVLAVDPSSTISAGSILGDKTRMTNLASHPNAFIRPSPSRPGTLGGLTPEAEDVISLLKAAKFDYIFIETIGIGQNELDAALLADTVMMIIAPTTGDELQGIKKGNLEFIDHLIINKFDGPSKELAIATADEYRSAFKGLKKDVFLISAMEKIGFDELFQAFQSPPTRSANTEQLVRRRIEYQLFKELYSLPSIAKIFEETNRLNSPSRIKAFFFIEQLKKLLT